MLVLGLRAVSAAMSRLGSAEASSAALGLVRAACRAMSRARLQ